MHTLFQSWLFYGDKMRLYVYIAKIEINIESSPFYVLSPPLSNKDAVKYLKEMSKGVESKLNKVVELYIPEKAFKQFRLDHPDTYYKYEQIEKFHILNNKYRFESFKLLGAVKEKEENKVEASQIGSILSL
jgi:hypothetical protein